MGTTHKTDTTRINRTTVLMVAALANCDPRTAERALRDGPDVIRTLREREALRAAIARVNDNHAEARTG